MQILLVLFFVSRNSIPLLLNYFNLPNNASESRKRYTLRLVESRGSRGEFWKEVALPEGKWLIWVEFCLRETGGRKKQGSETKGSRVLNQRFKGSRVRLLAMCRGELFSVIARLMSPCGSGR